LQFDVRIRAPVIWLLGELSKQVHDADDGLTSISSRSAVTKVTPRFLQETFSEKQSQSS